jgi:hypothetical protein
MAKLKLSDLKANLRAEVEGEWVEAPELPFDEETGEPVRLLVRSVHYPAYKQELAEVQLRLARQYPGFQAIPPEVEAIENGRLRAKHLLLGWNLAEEFSPELAMSVLTDPEYRPLSEATIAAARIVGTRRQAQQRAIEGNSKPASATS